MKKITLFIFSFLSIFSLQANTLEIAQAHIEANETEQALTVLKNLQNVETTANIQYLLAITYQNSNQLDKAIPHAIKAVELDPKVSNHHLVFAETQGQKLAEKGGVFKKLGIVKRVKRSFINAVNLDPSNIRARQGLMQFYTMAPGIAGGSKKKALEQAKAIFQLDKQKGYPALVQTYQASKKSKQLTETLTQWQKDFPDDWNALLSFSLYLQSQKRHAESYELLSSWLTKNPEHLPAQYQIGRLAAITGEYLDEGKAHLNSYLAKPTPNDAPAHQHAHWRLAMIYQFMEDLENAKIHIDNGLKLEPENKQLLDMKAKLK